MSDVMRHAITRHCRKYKYSAEYTQYWIANPFCLICGNYSAAPHHKKSRGAGGGDTSDNLMALCSTHHLEVHNLGKISFMKKYDLDKE